MLSKRDSSVLELQRTAWDRSVPVSQLLMMSKIIATKLGLDDALVWIDRELTGYKSVAELPAYRLLQGNWVAFPHYGPRQPIVFSDAQTESKASRVPVGMDIGALENACSRGEANSSISFGDTLGLRQKFIVDHDLRDARLLVYTPVVQSIIDRVRAIVLDWTLGLEKANVLGEGHSFTQGERREAETVTYQIIQNAGVVGNVSGGTISNRQQASIGIDADKLADAIEKARSHLGDLPSAVAAELKPALHELERQAPTASSARVQELLQSVRNILEGAAGSVVGEGLKVLFGMLI